MRSIPATLKSKLAERWQTAARDANPSMSVIATQASINTLISEVIHNGIPAAYGDATVHFGTGEKAPGYAYAICIDNGTAKIYGRKLPAEYEETWSHLWDLGAATDVAIEFDGTWAISADENYYNLYTDDTPWVFWVDGGNLYAQHWQDEGTRIQLAAGSGISACRLWQSTLDPTQDQGLAVAYIRDGAAYYRAYCYESAAGAKVWENENSITELGSTVETIQAFRTNDFRAGAIAETGDGIVWAITDRVYAGMSFRPEFAAAQIQNTVFNIIPVEFHNTIEDEHAAANINRRFLWFCPDGTPDLEITSATRVSTTEFTVTFDRDVTGADNLTAYASVTPSGGSAIAASAAGYDSETRVLTIDIPTEIQRSTAVTIDIEGTPDASYLIYQQQRCGFTAVETSIAGEIVTTQTIAQETAAATVSDVSVEFVEAAYYYPLESETAAATISNTSVSLAPAGTLSI